jgi:hypothetical protein
MSLCETKRVRKTYMCGVAAENVNLHVKVQERHTMRQTV